MTTRPDRPGHDLAADLLADLTQPAPSDTVGKPETPATDVGLPDLALRGVQRPGCSMAGAHRPIDWRKPSFVRRSRFDSNAPRADTR
jgi:hypothetical protein